MSASATTKTKIVPSDRRWLRIRDCMAYLGVSRDFVDALRESGKLGSYVLNGTVFISKSELDALIESSRV